jgi:hypothetical protein
LDGQPLGSVFEEMIESEPVEGLIEQGWIARPAYWTPMWNVELPRRSGQDFGDLVAAEMIPHARVLESMVVEYSKHAVGLPALGFAATKEKAIQYAAHFAASGIPADTLFGSDTDLKRQGTLARLRKGTLRVLWTCNVLGEGWDYPGLRCVMLARPTLSIARYLQQVARCMRPGDPPVVLDLWGAWNVFSPPWSDFGWSLEAKARRRLYKGERSTDGEVTWLPPVEVEGQLVRADTLVQTLCSVCGAPATRASAANAAIGKNKPYCAAHARGLNYGLPPLPCAICGEPATKMSSQNARAKGGARKPYCEKHKGGLLTKITRLPCAVCSAPATLNSTKMSLNRGDKPYCVQHKGGPSAKLPPLPCTICGAPATRSSSQNARRCGRKPYCEKHKGGPSAKLPPLPCGICGKPTSRIASSSARSRGGKAYCKEHRYGGRKTSQNFPLLPCAICGKPATKMSSETARLQGHRPYCSDHKAGSRPLLTCAICGKPASKGSSNSARHKGGKAYCKEHKKGPVAPKPLLPCAICGEPATKSSSLQAGYEGRKPYCEKHKGGGRKPPLLPCAICGVVTSSRTSTAARYRGGKAYCVKHKYGRNADA